MALSLVNKRRLAIASLIALIVIFGYLLHLPADYFDNGQSVCISVLFFDMKCYGCGMTRGIQHLIHGNFYEAFQYNKLSFIVLPLGVYMISSSLIKIIIQKSTED